MIEPAFSTPSVDVYQGDVLGVLRRMPDASVDCIVTSPPYWGLRDYGVEGQIGMEESPEEYVGKLVVVFREARRVLVNHGTLWLNIGDSYGTGTKEPRTLGKRGIGGKTQLAQDAMPRAGGPAKQLMGIPWRLAFALQADEWWLRSEIIWHKPNPMPESVTDRPTKAHEQVFLLSKSARYFYDADAISEPLSENTHMRMAQNVAAQLGSDRAHAGGKTNGRMKAVVRSPKTTEAGSGIKNNHSFIDAVSLPVARSGNKERTPRPGPEGDTRHQMGGVPWEDDGLGRNARTVWTINTQGYPGAHFATFPEELPRRCIKAGCPAGGTVLDPFAGSGTTLAVARDLGRRGVGIELNPEYVKLIEVRCAQLALL